MIIIEDGLIKYDPKTCTYLVYRERGWYPLLPLVLRLYLRDRYGITTEEALDAAMEEIRTKHSYKFRPPSKWFDCMLFKNSGWQIVYENSN